MNDPDESGQATTEVESNKAADFIIKIYSGVRNKILKFVDLSFPPKAENKENYLITNGYLS